MLFYELQTLNRNMAYTSNMTTLCKMYFTVYFNLKLMLRRSFQLLHILCTVIGAYHVDSHTTPESGRF